MMVCSRRFRLYADTLLLCISLTSCSDAFNVRIEDKGNGIFLKFQQPLLFIGSRHFSPCITKVTLVAAELVGPQTWHEVWYMNAIGNKCRTFASLRLGNPLPLGFKESPSTVLRQDRIYQIIVNSSPHHLGFSEKFRPASRAIA